MQIFPMAPNRRFLLLKEDRNMAEDRKKDPEITGVTINNLSNNYAPPEPGDKEEDDE